MTRHRRMLPMLPASAVAVALAAAPPPSQAQFDADLSEFFVRIEINATDGDVGLHTKLDGAGWGEMEITNPDGGTIYQLAAMNQLLDQGQTENFSESTEPLCFDPQLDDDPENDEEVSQTLADFLLRFGDGMYTAEGATIDGASIGATYDLQHSLPAAPDISPTDGRRFEIEDDGGVEIQWRNGDDFGRCSTGPGADDGGLEPTDEVELWEVTVEPVDREQVEEAGLPFTVYTVQLPANQSRVTVPSEYFRAYLQAGITDLKFEVGAKWLENQTFSEGEFTVALNDR